MTAPVTPDMVAAGLGKRGLRLWRDLAPGLGPAALLLLEEACRIADRLDRLDAILAGHDEAWLRVTGDGPQVTVVVDKALAEARQQAAVLKQIVAELRLHKAPAAPAARKEVSGVADLTARIAARRADTTG